MSKEKKAGKPASQSSPKGPLLLIVTVVLSYPVIKNVLAGQMPASSAAIRTGLAVVVAWAAIGGIANMIDGYRRHNAIVAAREAASARDETQPD